ncbi:MAG: hypothetical protein AAGI46_14450 [Planctomycetota bacterium]
MERVSLTPITQSDLDRPDSRWWMHLIPPVRRVPAFTAFCLAATGLLLVRVSRWVVSRGWPILATPMFDRGAGAMPLGRVTSRSLRQTLWVLPGLFVVATVLTWHAAKPALPPLEASLGLPAGVYAERVTLTADDGRELVGIWIPPSDIIRDEISKAAPAVVLVHDVGHDERQMLPLVARLHEQGFGVLAIRLRNAAEEHASPTTFGVKESLDVAAAVEHVRHRPLVDADRIAAWGVGYGANALRDAQLASPIALAVLEDAVDTSRSADERIVPEGRRFDVLRPVCRWMLAIGYDAAPRPKATPALRVVDIDRHVDGYRLVEQQFSNKLGIARLR